MSIPAMTKHAIAFLHGLGVSYCDVLGFSLGGMIAQQLALDRPGIIRKMILAGTAPRGGEDIMHIERPSLAQHFRDPNLSGYARLQKLFFAPTESSRSAGAVFITRLALRVVDRDAISSPEVAKTQIAAFRDWEGVTGTRFSELKRIQQPTLVVHGIHDETIPVRNAYWLGENLPNAVLMTYPDSAHGSLFRFH